MEELSDVYDQPNHLWRGSRAVSKLHKVTRIPRKEVKQWFAKKTRWQVHLPVQKQVSWLRFIAVKVPKQQHQFNVLHMPRSKFQGSVYKYILTGVDVALQ